LAATMVDPKASCLAAMKAVMLVHSMAVKKAAS
jgi:hypothetical protein